MWIQCNISLLPGIYTKPEETTGYLKTFKNKNEGTSWLHVHWRAKCDLPQCYFTQFDELHRKPYLVAERLLLCFLPALRWFRVGPPFIPLVCDSPLHLSIQLSAGWLGAWGVCCSCSKSSASRVWPRDRAMLSGKRPSESGIASARGSHW